MKTSLRFLPTVVLGLVLASLFTINALAQTLEQKKARNDPWYNPEQIMNILKSEVCTEQVKPVLQAYLLLNSEISKTLKCKLHYQQDKASLDISADLKPGTDVVRRLFVHYQSASAGQLDFYDDLSNETPNDFTAWVRTPGTTDKSSQVKCYPRLKGLNESECKIILTDYLAAIQKTPWQPLIFKGCVPPV